MLIHSKYKLLDEKDAFRYQPSVKAPDRIDYSFHIYKYDIIAGRLHAHYTNSTLPGLSFEIVFDGTISFADVHEQARKTLFAYLKNKKIVRPVTLYAYAYTISVEVYLNFVEYPSPLMVCGRSVLFGYHNGGFRAVTTGAP